jgi:hypothetical protein
VYQLRHEQWLTQDFFSVGGGGVEPLQTSHGTPLGMKTYEAVLDEGSGQIQAPVALSPGKCPMTHYKILFIK